MKITHYLVMTFIILGVLSACRSIQNKKNIFYYKPDSIESKNDLLVEYSKAYRVLDANNLVKNKESKQ